MVDTTQPANRTEPAVTRMVGMTEFDSGNMLNKKMLAYLHPDFTSGNNDNQPNLENVVVVAVFEDGEFSLENQYSTPFEDSNPEQKMSSLMALTQSGQGMTAMFDIMATKTESNGTISKLVAGGINGVKSFVEATGFADNAGQVLEGLKGKTSFTKINSQQIFTSSNGVKISGTLVFSAWADAKTEVEDAVQQLQEWATPAMLSNRSLLQNLNQKISLDALFSSIIPPTLTFSYGGKTYSPLVIESLSAPMTAPMNGDGDRIAVKCQITLLSLKAWDKNDITSLYRR